MVRLARQLTTSLALAASILPLGASLHAQTAATKPIAPPVLPLLVSYRYWPVQFIQFVGAELPYSMIELDVDSSNSKHPLLAVTLTERATGKRILYSDDDTLIASTVGSGGEAHKTALAYEAADNDNNGSITSVRFTMPDGKPLQWRFVQGTDMSEQGRGLNPFPGAKIPIFAYREQGAVAGEGTALQVGGVTSTASVWTEISKPPYFIGYHGAETESAHTLVFPPGQESWTITSAPSTLATGGTWELDEAHGNHRTVHIDKSDGAHLTVTSTEKLQPGVRCTMEATRDGDGWTLGRVRFSPLRDGEKHGLTLDFSAPLSPAATSAKFTIGGGKKSLLATGLLAGSGTSAEHAFTLHFSDPTWLAGAVLQEAETSTDTGWTLVAHP